MATKIVTKNSSTAGAAPTATDLVQGELAVNVADGRLYTEDNAAAIVELGVNPATEITANAGIALPDSQKATFGTSDDLQIYHDTHSYIQDTGTGSLFFLTQGAEISLFGNTSAEYMGRFIQDGAVELYHNGAKKLATTSTGIDVTGTASATSVTSAQHLTAGSAYSLLFGDGGERISGNNSSSLLNFFTGATERMRIDSIGRVGIGTSSPSAVLETFGGTSFIGAKFKGYTTGKTALVGTDNNSAWFGLDDGTYGLTNSIQLFGTNNSIEFNTAGTERMRIDASGKVGIGTSSPAETLDVKSGNASTYLRLQTSTDTGVYVGNANGQMLMLTGATERMRIDSSGRVGIGTSSPANTLTIKGSVNQLDIETTTAGVTLESVDRSDLNAQSDLSYYARHGEHKFFGASYTERLRIDSSGSVGIGTSSPTTRLDVRGGVNSAHATFTGQASRGLVISTANTLSNDDAVVYNAQTASSGKHIFQIAGTERMRIDSSGNLLVGVTSITDATSRTFGNAFAGSGSYGNWTSWGSGNHTHAIFRNGTGVAGTITTAGSLTTAYNTSSDQRLKENIADADDAGSKVDAIQVRKYDWKADGSHQDYGMIAQELLEVAPEAVSVPEDSEEMMGVDYSKLVPMLIKEIQSLRNRVAQLETGE